MMHQKLGNKEESKQLFYPKENFVKHSHLKSLDEYKRIFDESIKNPEKFWEEQAQELYWQKQWSKVLDWECPDAKWFVGGKINVAENCLDRHLTTHTKEKIALIFEGEPGDVRYYTYEELHLEVCRFANALKNQGAAVGDRVIIYMPMIPEAVIAMLACARIGATHSVIFGGFSPESIRDRTLDCRAKFIITADGGWRRGKIVPLKENVDKALEGVDCVKKVIVCKRVKNKAPMQKGRDISWKKAIKGMPDHCDAEELDSEHPLFLLYTSGSTGKPKGILHSTGGYLLQCYLTTKYYFDLQKDDIYWCTADVGWITGHSYITYGPLANGTTVMLYEGAPNFPKEDRFWDIIERHEVSILYTAPTAIRAFIKWGDEHVDKHDLSSLRLLGTVGEPINPEAWLWYHKKIGGENCPIVDTWWQTETGAQMLAPMPGAIPTKPGSATLPFFGIDAAVVDDDGNELPHGQAGKLVIRQPWPSMLRGIYGDPERYQETYWDAIPGMYLAGDAAKRDENGYFHIIGRIDDVLNVSGHRIGTAEIESALVSHDTVAEAAVVGKPHDLKGETIVAFVTLKGSAKPSDDLKKELALHVRKIIGAHAYPEEIRFTEALPKTRSGKIMRRLLKEICRTGKISGDLTTLEDFNSLAKLQSSSEK